MVLNELRFISSAVLTFAPSSSYIVFFLNLFTTTLRFILIPNQSLTFRVFIYKSIANLHMWIFTFHFSRLTRSKYKTIFIGQPRSKSWQNFIFIGDRGNFCNKMISLL